MGGQFSRRHLFRTWLAGLFGLAADKVLPNPPAEAVPTPPPTPTPLLSPYVDSPLTRTTFVYDASVPLTPTLDRVTSFIYDAGSGRVVDEPGA